MQKKYWRGQRHHRQEIPARRETSNAKFKRRRVRSQLAPSAIVPHLVILFAYTIFTGCLPLQKDLGVDEDNAKNPGADRVNVKIVDPQFLVTPSPIPPHPVILVASQIFVLDCLIVGLGNCHCTKPSCSTSRVSHETLV